MKTTMQYKITHGFTLIEIAMVLMIVALVLGGLLPTISSQIEQRRISETRKQLADIQQALIGFSVLNNRLPCPADGTIATIPGVSNGAGTEKNSCPTNANGGVLPWVTLGVNETDAWGQRFTYRVTPVFSVANFQLNSIPNLDVGLTSASTDKNVAAGVPAIVVSHGSNGLGAYVPAGGNPPNSATGDELDNVATNNNNHFTSHDLVQGGFDDIVVWISPNILFNRMVSAGKLP